MADEPPNKRTSARNRVYKEGKIVFANGSFVIDCTIDSLSEDGAHVRVLGSAPIPKEFLLVEPSRGVVHKATIVRRTVEESMDRQVAATYLQQHPATTFHVDLAAAAGLTRIATPWLLHEVEWTTEMAVQAVVWLAQRAGKAILKLTPADYNEHHLASLMAAHGDAGAVNGLAFNALGARIRGRSRLPRGKKIVCFSPHPDDDVISMGGMLRKLVLNGN